ncbi:hypothetical protein SLA2020_059440 [Shorea laevis]
MPSDGESLPPTRCDESETWHGIGLSYPHILSLLQNHITVFAPSFHATFHPCLLKSSNLSPSATRPTSSCPQPQNPIPISTLNHFPSNSIARSSALRENPVQKLFTFLGKS